jgi:hypothetical protein
MVRCIYNEDRQREIIKALIAEILDRLHGLPSEITETQRFARPYIDLDCRVALHRFALMLKHPKFAEEAEWRIISDTMMEDPPGQGDVPLDYREGKSAIIPYRCVPLKGSKNDFPLTEIVIGPTPDPEQAYRSVRSLLKSQGPANCTVRMSDVPYRAW